MREIILYKNKGIVLIDNEDFEIISKYKWHNNGCGYAKTSIKINNKWVNVYMPHIILNIPKNIFIDHIDGNPLNNQKENLRIVTNSQNQMNSKKQKNTISKFKGVSWDKGRKRFVACIKLNNKSCSLGRFKSEIDAAKAYNKKAKELYGEFANLNIIEE